MLRWILLRKPEDWGWTVRNALTCGTLQEAFQLATAYRVLQFANRLGFDLSYPLTGNFENPTNFFQCVGIAIPQSVAETNDFTFPVGKGFE